MGAMIHSRAKWYESGEKSNKYFLKLETHSKAKSSVRKIVTKDGFLTSDPREIMNEIKDFYSDLYKQDALQPSDNLTNAFLECPGMPQLSDDDALFSEGKLTVSECLR